MHAADELRRAFEAAGSVFCVPARQMTAALRRISKNHYWGMFRNFLWYRWSAVVEGVHAMMAGFLRHKPYVVCCLRHFGRRVKLSSLRLRPSLATHQRSRIHS